MSTILRSALLAASVAAALFSTPSQAVITPIDGTTSGLGSGAHVEDFEKASVVLHSDPAGQFPDLTFYTPNNSSVVSATDAPTLTDSLTRVIANYGPDETSVFDTTIITFVTPITGVAMRLAFDFLYSLNFTVYNSTSIFDSSTQVGYFDATADSNTGAFFSDRFYGFSGDELFSSIQVFGYGGKYFIDNLQTPGKVPEPETLALVGLGLLGLAATRRRRRA